MPRDLAIRERRSVGRWPRAGRADAPGTPGLRGRIHRKPAPVTRSLLAPIVSLCVLVLTSILTAGPGVAGPNENGVLILHCNPALEGTSDGDFSGRSDLYEGKNAVTQVAGDGQRVVYFVIAAFDDFAMPRLKSYAFGIELSSSTAEPFRFGPTGDGIFELRVGAWPSSGSGTAITVTEPFTRRVNEVYWFCGYAYAGQTVKLVKCPGQATAIMSSDAFPAEEDEVAGWGKLGFGVAGYNPLSDGMATGACCSTSGRCVLQTEAGCTSRTGYTYSGDLTICSPNPCTPGVGACCLRAECRMLQWDECAVGDGIFMYGTGCSPSPCDFTRVGTTWGVLKSTYRPD